VLRQTHVHEDGFMVPRKWLHVSQKGRTVDSATSRCNFFMRVILSCATRAGWACISEHA
jgi:hypothetical protein